MRVSRHNAHRPAFGVAASFEQQILTWDFSAFYFLAVNCRIRSIRIGVRRGRFEPRTRAGRIVECVIDDDRRGEFCDSDLDFHQRNIVQCGRLMDRYRGNQRHAKYRFTQ
jgi:hypothetical protein